MNVFWLQQTESDVSPGTDWLCDSELLSLRGLSVPKRRADWRLGRWTAKCAVAAYFGHSMEFCVLRDIEISHNASGAPEVSLAGNSPGIEISLSHRSGTAVCAIAPTGTLLGCDLEVVEPHSEAFVRDYFSAEEQAFVMDLPSAYRPGFLALLWSAKESALKALQQGLRRDTRSVVLAFLNGSSILAGNHELTFQSARWEPGSCDLWRTLTILDISRGQLMRGWWQSGAALIRTVIADPPSLPPVLLTAR